jgi:hypothetical protein
MFSCGSSLARYDIRDFLVGGDLQLNQALFDSNLFNFRFHFQRILRVILKSQKAVFPKK